MHHYSVKVLLRRILFIKALSKDDSSGNITAKLSLIPNHLKQHYREIKSPVMDGANVWRAH